MNASWSSGERFEFLFEIVAKLRIARKNFMIFLTLPWPPSNNRYYRHIAKGKLAGRTLLSEAGRDYREAVQTLAAANGAQKRLEGRLSLFIAVRQPDRRKRDLDNLIKAVQDALQFANCFADDSQIDVLMVIRDPDIVKGGRIDIILEDFDAI
jgi:crossover junction endodeoxyribonuclease RusA